MEHIKENTCQKKMAQKFYIDKKVCRNFLQNAKKHIEQHL